MLTDVEAVTAVRAQDVEFSEMVLAARPTRVPGVWSVVAVEAAGGSWLVGPDRQVWEVSSNPGIHDYDTVLRVLGRVYADGLARFVDPPALMDRLATLTGAQRAAEEGLLEEVRAGAVRAVDRRLP